MKTLFYIIIVVLTLLGFACQDNDTQDYYEELEIPDSLQKEILKNELLSGLCHVDTIDASEYSYRPKYGIQYEKEPTTFLLKSTEKEDSYSFFESLIPPYERDKIIVTGTTSIYSIDEESTIKHTYTNTEDIESIIEIDMPEIPMIKRLVYVPAEQWPYNDISSPFRVGSVWERTYKSQTARYICVREFTGKNNPGIMMTFDNGWDMIPYLKYHNYYPTPTNCASRFAWEKLMDLYEVHRTAFEEAVQLKVIPPYIFRECFIVGSIKILWENPLVSAYRVDFFEGSFHSRIWENRINTPLFPWNFRGSSHVEFAESKPDGVWKEIEIDFEE